ncbi:MAG TPA: heat-inducible transcriptional repressor HrcA [Vicinamibacterales bacterium]|nr:heat-inducible transcriptional repressor HrcA [Vicinamibacterales bacterium]
MGTEALTPRSGRILATLVREYIQTGEPVSSSTVAKRGIGVSPATVRNTFSVLERHGYVRQPHTSAGRVPTDRGYRFYVDMLLGLRRPSRSVEDVAERLRREAGGDPLLPDLLAQVSHLLSTESHHVGFALAAPVEDARLERIEFIPLAASKVLVVVIARGGQMSQKAVDIGEPMTPDELRGAAEHLNRDFGGAPLNTVRSQIVARLMQERTLYDRLMARALEIASRSLEDAGGHTLFVEGAASLLDQATNDEDGGVTLDRLRALLELMEEKQRLIRLLTEYLDGPGLTVVIGAEHSDPNLHPFSLIASTYCDGRGIGGVGVIGPRRMRYSKAIAMVDGVARAVSRVLQTA